jgi:serine/threonine protein kinase
MHLEREGRSGLAVVIDDGERFITPTSDVRTYVGGANDWSGVRGTWTEATLHGDGDGAALLLYVVDVLDHDGGTERTTKSVHRSEDGGRHWATCSRPMPQGAPIATLSTGLRHLVRAGDFRLVRRLGGGALGDLYEAFDPQGELVALRFLRAHDDPSVRAAIAPLAEKLPHVRHRHLVGMRTIATLEDGRIVAASDLVDGACSLERASVTPERARTLAIAILEALDALHAAKVVHGDVEPANVLLDRDWPRLADAGLGLALGDRRGMRRTRAAVRIDLAYSPPEALQRLALDERSDLYAVGACLYALLAGRPPFEAKSSVALGLAVLTEEPAPLLPSTSTPAGVAAVVTRALQKDPGKRFASAAEMRAALGGR